MLTGSRPNWVNAQGASDVEFLPAARGVWLVSKCEEYIATGSDVAGLLKPRNRTVTICRPDEVLRIAPVISAVIIGREMPGFTLNAQAVFNAGEDFT